MAEDAWKHVRLIANSSRQVVVEIRGGRLLILRGRIDAPAAAAVLAIPTARELPPRGSLVVTKGKDQATGHSCISFSPSGLFYEYCVKRIRAARAKGKPRGRSGAGTGKPSPYDVQWRFLDPKTRNHFRERSREGQQTSVLMTTRGSLHSEGQDNESYRDQRQYLFQLLDELRLTPPEPPETRIKLPKAPDSR